MIQNKNNFLSFRQKELLFKLNKFQRRIQRKIKDGSFAKMAYHKRLKSILRLRRYALKLHQLGCALRLGAISSALVIALSLTTPASAQIFIEVIGSSNPLDGFFVGTESVPAFVDIDNDGDMDCFSGELCGAFFYYENIGTAANPVFIERTGSSNPLDGLDVGAYNYSQPSFADIDDDGDMDCFSGSAPGTIHYFKNIGTAANPVFTEVTGMQNPFDGVILAPNSAAPGFVDIDNDGDLDAFCGEYIGVFNYYQNTGTATDPVFTEVTGPSNPMDGFDVGAYSKAAFVDIDNDGDMDCFSGESQGAFYYYKNTGTVSSPAFLEITGSGNPMNGFEVETHSTPAIVDIDNDGDMDIFSGEVYGNFNYYQNTGILPVELLDFNGRPHNDDVLLEWTTASETNNKGFELQRSVDGLEWETITFIPGHGTNQQYSYIDRQASTGLNYYRLKQIDYDGAFEYSETISIRFQNASSFIEVFPNPFSEFIEIKSNGQELNQITVTDLKGLPLKQFLPQEENRVDLSDLTSGIYILEISIDNQKIHEKIVKL